MGDVLGGVESPVMGGSWREEPGEITYMLEGLFTTSVFNQLT